MFAPAIVRRGSCRAVTAAVAAFAALTVAAPAALAAPADAPPTVALSPSDVSVSLLPDQVTGTQPLAPAIFGRGHTPVPVAFGGAVTFELPAQLTSAEPPLTAALELSAGDGTGVTRTYSSDSAVPADQLVLTDLGAGRYRVDLPADDGVNGPAARLVLGPLQATTPGAEFTDPAAWALELSAAAPASVDLTSQLIATSFLDCGDPSTDWASCPVTATVIAGQTLQITLPVDSSLVALGLPDLSRSAVAITPYNEGPGVPLEPYAQVGGLETKVELEAVISADGRTATLTVPAGTAPQRYLLSIGLIDASGRLFSLTRTNLDVVAPANAGLRSDTGWGEAAEDAGTSTLVPLGAGMIVLAGAGTVAALRMRRRTDSSA